MEESTAKVERCVAALMIFIVVVALQFLSRYFEINKMKGFTSSEDMQLRAEIKQLLKEASALSQPSTFAQAVKLRRLAAAKEKELAKNLGIHSKETKLSYDTYTKGLTILQVLTYFLLIIWFWSIPVASISKQLVQPLGKMLSWRAGGLANENVMVMISRNCFYPVMYSIEEIVTESSEVGLGFESLKVGIIPWLILSTRVSKSISRRILK